MAMTATSLAPRAAHEASVADRAEDDALRDEGIPRMTLEVLSQCCKQHGGYLSPELNEVLPLQYKGFRKIENLAPFTGLKSLFLECNGIRRIEGLEGVPGLVQLYLQSNCISKIENLDGLTSLQVLNLSNNSISRIENLAPLGCLETLKLASNKIADATEALAGLADRPTLKSVDLSMNYIEDGENLIDFWGTRLPDVECLYLHHNSCSRYLKDYRRRMISTLPRLRWLDERLVRADERAGAEAWAQGGKDAEWEAKKAFYIKEKEEKARSFNDYLRMSKATAARAQAQREQREQLDRARAEAAATLQATGSLEEGWVSMPARSKPAESSDGTGADSGRQQKVRDSVRAFLDSRRSKEEASSTAASEESNIATTLLETSAATLSAAANEQDEGAASFDLDSMDDDPVHPAAISSTALPDAPPEESAPFVWSDFRDKRLGRLVAEHRYNFQLAAEALGAEFNGAVSTEECRARYRELVRPSKPKSAAKEGGAANVAPSGLAYDRAIDGPKPSREAVKEVSDWWVRKLAASQSEGPKANPWNAAPSASRPSEAVGSPGVVDDSMVQLDEAIDDAVAAAAARQSPVDAGASLCPLASLAASGPPSSSPPPAAPFAPPPRSRGAAAADAEVAGLGAAPPAAAPVITKAPTTSSDLFGLD